MNTKKLIGKVLTRIPYIRYAYLYKHNSSFRPGHYYSPVADVDDLVERQDEIWAEKSLPGIDLNEETQKEFLTYLLNNESSFGIPWNKEPSKIYYGNSPSYQYVDGVVLHAMVAKHRPKNIIEVGSGASSGCMIDASELHGLKTRFTFIEPEPQYCLDKVLKKEDYKSKGVTLIRERVQKVSPEEFKILGENDILFIDSSHVSKPGSDVNFLLTQVLPILNKGVIIHFHDIYYPFEYTKEYLLELKLLWSEVYSLHNFLLFNNSFKIIFFSDYMRLKVTGNPSFASNYPPAGTSPFINHPVRPKNLWIQRI
ncbi:MAG TPA: class I SAM-dependent methyltransferase [Puia sp.]|nr:class I SAM-dependent methyltransferase [Puia sp.]